MNEQREAIAELLQNDSTLTDMLASNHPFWKPGAAKDKKWSIIPADKIKKQSTPFVSIQAGNTNQADYHLLEDFFYVRCYNSDDKTYVSITDVLSRVYVLLHRHRFNFTGTTSVETLFETMGAELHDEAFGLNYREARYRLLRI